MDGHELRRRLDVHEQIAKVYADTRFPKSHFHPDLRTLAVTILWVVGVERPPKGGRWKRIYEVLHFDDQKAHDNYRFWQIIASDAPRWEPPQEETREVQCEAPMIRRSGPCGKRTSWRFRVTDPETGQWRMTGTCSRHDEYGRQLRLTEKALQQAGGIPEPLPNTGGLLPCYFNWKWPDMYAQARPGWKPPRIGICADDWPVMAKVTAMEPPSLSLIEGDGQAEDGALFPGAPPSLSIV